MLTAGWIFLARPDDKLHLVFCDVGQGDGAIVIKGEFQMLIDTGPKNGGVVACLSKHMPFWDKQIEVLVNSHPEADHLGDLGAVASRYRIESLVTDGKIPPREELGRQIKKLVEGGTRLEIVAKGDTIIYSDLRFDVVWPEDKPEELLAYLNGTDSRLLGKESSLNQYAIVMKLTYGKFTAWYTGDIGQAEEAALAADGVLSPAAVLKVAHHGSKYSSSRAFLTAVAPKLAVISVGRKNSYGHPTREALTRLTEAGARLLRTDKDGEVEVVSDGERFWLLK